MAISKLHEKCQKCEYKDECDEKRMVACAIITELPPLNENASMPIVAGISMPVARVVTPITINMGEYGVINTSLEELKKELEEDFYRQIRCDFRRS